MPRTTTCTYHCAACGLHFHSLHAFDAHRQGDFGSDEPATGRRCVHPLDMRDRLVPLTVDGECRMYGDRVKRVATIWTDGRDLGRVGRDFASGASPGAQERIVAFPAELTEAA